MVRKYIFVTKHLAFGFHSNQNEVVDLKGLVLREHYELLSQKRYACRKYNTKYKMVGLIEYEAVTNILIAVVCIYERIKDG